MSGNTQPLFPGTVVVGIASLTSAAAVTSRANISGTTGLTALTPVSTNGKRIDAIQVKGKATTVASQLFIWLSNGTTAFLLDELEVTAVPASNTVTSFELAYYPVAWVVPATYSLWVSQTVATDLNVFAFGGDY